LRIGKRGIPRRLDDGSRMSGDVPVRICEGLEVKFLRSTHLRIYIGRHSDITQVAYLRHSTTVSRTMAGPNPPLPSGISRNIQSITFLVGPLFFHVLSARVNDFDLDAAIKYSQLARLWPQPVAPININSLAVVHSWNLRRIANSLDQLLAQHSVKYGGPLPKDGTGVI
jgi:hypothetical protein